MGKAEPGARSEHTGRTEAQTGRESRPRSAHQAPPLRGSQGGHHGAGAPEAGAPLAPTPTSPQIDPCYSVEVPINPSAEAGYMNQG